MCYRASWLGPVPTTLTTGMKTESIVHGGFACEQRLGGVTPRAFAPLLPDSGDGLLASFHLMSGQEPHLPSRRPDKVF